MTFTFWWFARRGLSAELVASALAETVRRVKRDDQRCQAALDSTGLWLTHTSRSFEWRAKRERGQRGWLKWALAMWVGPQMLLAQRVRPGPAGDFPDLVLLATDASAVMAFDEVLADAGYDSEANHRFCRETLGVHSLIPTKKRRSIKVIATTPYRQEMHRLLSDPGDAASKRAYRQRWKVEMVLPHMTKAPALAVRTERDDIADFHLTPGNDDAVDQQLHKLAAPREMRFPLSLGQGCRLGCGAAQLSQRDC